MSSPYDNPFSPEDLDKADALLDQIKQKQRRKKLLLLILVPLIILAIIAAILAPHLSERWKIYTLKRSLNVDHVNMSTIERVHVQLLPGWLIHISNQHSKEPQKFDDLVATLQQEDPDAVALVTELRDMLLQPDRLVEFADALLAIVDLWNQRLEQAKLPWWVEANVMSSRGKALFYVKTYKILADFHVQVGNQPHRTRISARADNTNIVESMLGHTSPSDKGAFILADRLYDFSLSQVWPLLQQEPSTLKDRQRAFSQPIKEEVKNLLTPEDYKRLTTYAEQRHNLEQAIASIRERRQTCGSNFSISHLPWDGFPEHEFDRLRRFVERDRYADCPSITEDELNTIERATDALADDPKLQQSAGALVSAMARAITVHEARHAADHTTQNGLLEPLPCPQCDDAGLSTIARAELSAYLASFAHKESSMLALYQACSVRDAHGTPHANALRFALPKLQTDCDTTPPSDLSARAQRLEQDLFGRSDTITLPKSNYPEHLELYKK